MFIILNILLKNVHYLEYIAEKRSLSWIYRCESFIILSISLNNVHYPEYTAEKRSLS